MTTGAFSNGRAEDRWAKQSTAVRPLRSSRSGWSRLGRGPVRVPVLPYRRTANVRQFSVNWQFVASNVVTLALCTLAPACRGGKPVIEFEAPPAPTSDISDGGLTTIGDVVTIESGCATSTTRGQLRPSNLLFVLDRSGSMACNLPQDGQSSQNCAAFPAATFPDKPTKWDLTRQAVLRSLGELRTAGDVRVGLTLFPKSGTRCVVATEPDLPITQLDQLLEQRVSVLLSSALPGGETPLAGATILSYAYLLDEMRSGRLEGETFVVIVTDGYETCKPDEIPKLLEVDVPTARNAIAVRSFVIGAPGSDQGRALLSKFAVAGGTETSADCYYGPGGSDGNCHYDMTRSLDFSADLLGALTRINSEVMACSIEIPSAPNGGPVNLQEVNVSVNGESRTMVASGPCNSANGWRYSSDLTTIQLCGNVCRDAKRQGSAVTVILGCPTVIQ